MKKDKQTQKVDTVSTENQRMIYYEPLHFIPIEEKNERWAAEVLYFIKQNSKQFVAPSEVAEKRKNDNNIIDDKKYKAIVDPHNKKAEYFSADWKGNPIFVHLNSIIDARIEKLPNNIMVKAADEFSKMKQQKDNERILARNQFRTYINEMNAKFGLPQLKETEDPFSYVERLDEENGKGAKAIPVGMIDSLKAAIEDNEDLALYNEYVYKDGVEIAAEIGIKHYLFEVNRFLEYSEDILWDLRLFFKSLCRFYTSDVTGLPVFEYMQPHEVWLSPYKKRDGSDVVHWFIEYDVTYGNFVRMFGASMEKDELREVFALNQQYHGINDFDNCGYTRRVNATIRIGYCEMESQDMEVYAEYEYGGNMKYKRTGSNFQPSEKAKNKGLKSERDERHYNVWRSFYYLPLVATSVVSGTTDFEKQSKYIYKLKKMQDQQRYGDDMRYARNSLMMYYSVKPSFYDVLNEFMPQIHLLWNQTKNDIANAIPHGLVWIEEFLTAALQITDEENEKPGELKEDIVSKIQQTGSAIVKMLNKDNEVVAGGKPFIEVKTGHLDTAISRINAIMVLYTLMTRSLSISEAAEGLDPKSRQSFAGTQLALAGSENSTFGIEKAYSKFITQGAEKLLYYFKDIVDGGDSDRLQDFMDIVGQANGMAMKSIKDIPMHKLGLTVVNEITAEQKAALNQIANQMAAAGVLDPDIAMFIITVENLKYAFAILRLKMKQKKRELDAATQAEREFQLQMKQMDLDFAMQKQSANNEDMFKIREMMKQWDAKLQELDNQFKQQGQIAAKKEITAGRIQQDLVKHELDKENRNAPAA